MEIEKEDPVLSFYNATKDNEESRIKRQQTHQINSFASDSLSIDTEIPKKPYKTVSLRTDDEETDCSEYVSQVQDWIEDVESIPELKQQYGYWTCCEGNAENYLVLEIPIEECLIEHRKYPMVKDLSLFYMILEKLNENEKIEAIFSYDVYTTFLWSAFSICKWTKYAKTSYGNYRIEVRMRKSRLLGLGMVIFG
jgi:hypothetical protein